MSHNLSYLRNKVICHKYFAVIVSQSQNNTVLLSNIALEHPVKVQEYITTSVFFCQGCRCLNQTVIITIIFWAKRVFWAKTRLYCLVLQQSLYIYFFFLKDFIYLFEGDCERAAEREGEADSPLSREPDMGSIPGPWDHDLNQRQTLYQLSHLGTPIIDFIKCGKLSMSYNLFIKE